MHVSRRIASKLLIWLTAILMPFQAGWATNCGCCSAKEPAEATASGPIPTSCCCKPATPKPTCCEGSAPQRTCCKRTSDRDQAVGCQCGPNCQCVNHDQSPTQPPAPAPDNGRGQSVVGSAVSQPATIYVPVADSSAHALAAESDCSFYQPGAQVCVLLCRFTL